MEIDLQNNECSIIISTCDDYSDTWFPFFELFKKFWKDNPFEIFLNCETKSYKHEGLEINSIICENKNLSWTRRLYNAVNQINSKYVIFMLDDFFSNR